MQMIPRQEKTNQAFKFWIPRHQELGPWFYTALHNSCCVQFIPLIPIVARKYWVNDQVAVKRSRRWENWKEGNCTYTNGKLLRTTRTVRLFVNSSQIPTKFQDAPVLQRVHLKRKKVCLHHEWFCLERSQANLAPAVVYTGLEDHNSTEKVFWLVLFLCECSQPEWGHRDSQLSIYPEPLAGVISRLVCSGGS